MTLAVAALIALAQIARTLEEAAPRAPEPALLHLEAARLRREAAERAFTQAAVEQPRAQQLLKEAGSDAQVCADDARRAWQLLAPASAKLQAAGKPAAEVFAASPAAAAEPIYLEAVCASIWARAQGVTALLERHGELQAALERAAQLAPELDEGGPDRELGRLLASLPAYAGGDLEGARAAFERSLKLAPGAARTHVAFAEGVAVRIQDRALFTAQLTPAAAASEKGALADKARALLQRAEELFGK